MKKLLLLLIALCAVGVVFFACMGSEEAPEPAVPTEAPSGEQSTPEPEQEPSGVDYAAIYALHEPEEIVMTVDGREISWQEYYYYYYNVAANWENGFVETMYYGGAAGWESPADAEGHSYAQILPTSVERMLRRDLATEAIAQEHGISLTEEDEAAIRDAYQEDLAYIQGLGYTEEQFFTLLEPFYVSEEMYWRSLRSQVLYTACYRELVGENGEKLPEQQVLDWMEAQGYLSLDRIRIATVDSVTGQSLPAEAAAQQEALAEELSARLRSIEDPQEREALFLELKAQYDPQGLSYVANADWVDPEIYAATAALEPGEVSPVLALDGDYYIILRRPLSTEDEISTTYSRDPVRSILAGKGLEPLLEERMAAQKLAYAPNFAPPEILDYYTKPNYAA